MPLREDICSNLSDYLRNPTPNNYKIYEDILKEVLQEHIDKNDDGVNDANMSSILEKFAEYIRPPINRAIEQRQHLILRANLPGIFKTANQENGPRARALSDADMDEITNVEYQDPNLAKAIQKSQQDYLEAATEQAKILLKSLCKTQEALPSTNNNQTPKRNRLT